MNDLSKMYVIEREFTRADYYNDENEEGGFIMRDIFFPASTELDILRCEEILKCKLPQSYRNFLLIHDGALMSTFDSELYGEVNVRNWMYAPADMILMSTEYLVEFTNEQKERYYSRYEESWEEYNKRWSNLIGFCYLGGQGDGSFLAFDPSQAIGEEYPILYCLSTKNVEEWRSEIYYRSFKDFFVDVLESTETGQNYNFLDRYLKSLGEDT